MNYDYIAKRFGAGLDKPKKASFQERLYRLKHRVLLEYVNERKSLLSKFKGFVKTTWCDDDDRNYKTIEFNERK